MIRAKLPYGYCDLVRTDVWNGRVNHPEEHDIVKYTAISWYREEFVGGVDLGRNYMHAKYKFFELVVNKKYILEMDGGFHYRDVSFSQDKISYLKDTKSRDEKKNLLAKSATLNMSPSSILVQQRV